MNSPGTRGPIGVVLSMALALACTSEDPLASAWGGASSLGGNAGSSGASSPMGGMGVSSGGSSQVSSTALLGGGSSTTPSGGTTAIGGRTSSGGAALGGTTTGGTSQGGTANGGAARGGATASGGSGNTTVDTGLPTTCGATSCNAATPVNPTYTTYGMLGNVTMYTILASDGGACQYGSTKVMYFAAINVNLAPGDAKGQWQEGRFCGQCVEVTALTSQGPKSVVVRIMDRCADADCGIDLGGSAPSSVMADGFGRYQGAWRAVSCAGHPEVFDGEPSLYVKEGVSAYWSVVQVRNPTSAVLGIDWQKQGASTTKGTLTTSAPSIENFWSVPAEVLQGSATFDFTVRYSDGSTATVSLSSAQLATAGAQYPLD